MDAIAAQVRLLSAVADLERAACPPDGARLSPTSGPVHSKGRSNVRILDARYPELGAELKPGKVLKLAQSK